MYRIKARLNGIIRRIIFGVQSARGKVIEKRYNEGVTGWHSWLEANGRCLAFREDDTMRLFFDW